MTEHPSPRIERTRLSDGGWAIRVVGYNESPLSDLAKRIGSSAWVRLDADETLVTVANRHAPWSLVDAETPVIDVDFSLEVADASKWQMSFAMAETGIDIEFSGGCPVEGVGEVDDAQVYFRSRGTSWSMEFTWEDPAGDRQAWEFEGAHKYPWPDAGWLPPDRVREHVREAVTAFRSHIAGIEQKDMT